MREAVRNGYYHRFRRAISSSEIANDLDARSVGLSLNARGRLVYEYILERETPLVFPGERIIFTRTIEGNLEFPMAGLDGTRHTDVIENLTPDWSLLLKEGLLGRRAACQKALEKKGEDPEAVDFLTNAIAAIDAVASFAKRYSLAAEEPLQRALLEKVPPLSRGKFPRSPAVPSLHILRDQIGGRPAHRFRPLRPIYVAVSKI